MTVWEAFAILAAGFTAGGINTVVGSGSLVTFPVLVALGYPAVQAAQRGLVVGRGEADHPISKAWTSISPTTTS